VKEDTKKGIVVIAITLVGILLNELIKVKK
jgi:hypothetical protein